MLICRIDAWILVILGVLGSSIKGLIFLMDLNTLFFFFLFWGVLCLQQQEDEEMLVPHADLAENNHQPMDGVILVFLLICIFSGLIFQCLLIRLNSLNDKIMLES